MVLWRHGIGHRCWGRLKRDIDEIGVGLSCDGALMRTDVGFCQWLTWIGSGCCGQICGSVCFPSVPCNKIRPAIIIKYRSPLHLWY